MYVIVVYSSYENGVDPVSVLGVFGPFDTEQDAFAYAHVRGLKYHDAFPVLPPIESN